jgi:hypothetical protein
MVRSHSYPELHCEICHKQMRKDERDKVLDELDKYCNDEENLIYKDRPYGGWDDATLDQGWLLKKLKELRQAGEP